VGRRSCLEEEKRREEKRKEEEKRNAKKNKFYHCPSRKTNPVYISYVKWK